MRPLGLLLVVVQVFVQGQLLRVRGRNDADLIVLVVSTSSIVDRVNVKLRRRRLAGKLSESLHKFLLEVVVDVVLLSEEHNTTL